MDREEVRGATTADAHMQPETKRDEASRASANRRRECARASAGCGSAPAPTGPPAPVPPACARELCQMPINQEGHVPRGIRVARPPRLGCIIDVKVAPSGWKTVG